MKPIGARARRQHEEAIVGFADHALTHLARGNLSAVREALEDIKRRELAFAREHESAAEDIEDDLDL